MRNKLVLCSVAAAIGLSAPTASADMVDDYLAKVPAGQISCEQATKYYTNPSDYNSKKSQALAAANFHPRVPRSAMPSPAPTRPSLAAA
ncbi:hypothetical protein [Corynebacterium guaraldiae]|uniref:hypothetical protein n=1 Tax=Corynebacterium guaraldiae TaxID=3051103 RepID=UPI001E438A5F|nr:hypothetical protein [Corynebacterium guaraldiae]